VVAAVAAYWEKRCAAKNRAVAEQVEVVEKRFERIAERARIETESSPGKGAQILRRSPARGAPGIRHRIPLLVAKRIFKIVLHPFAATRRSPNAVSEAPAEQITPGRLQPFGHAIVQRWRWPRSTDALHRAEVLTVSVAHGQERIGRHRRTLAGAGAVSLSARDRCAHRNRRGRAGVINAVAGGAAP
jgi:hypothetical protein